MKLCSRKKHQLIKNIVANYITKLRGLKRFGSKDIEISGVSLQIISQNYVVWNLLYYFRYAKVKAVANYITKLRGLKQAAKFAIDSFIFVANYITKLRGLKLHIFQMWIVSQNLSCKLYHKTTWFETRWWRKRYICAGLVANYITKLRGLKLKLSNALDANANALQIISQNYVVWNTRRNDGSFEVSVSCKLYHKTTWFETWKSARAKSELPGCKLYHKTTWFETT